MVSRAPQRLALVAALAFVGCTIPDLDFTGKQCPCPDGWSCVAGACARAAATDGPVGRITVGNLRAAWSTPNSIRWEWDVAGSKDDFGEFQLTVASQPPGAGGSMTWTSAVNVELGRLYLPNPNGNEDLVTGTITDQHDTDTTYVATLVALDSSGNRSVSNQAQTATTVQLTHTITFFSNATPPGYPLPPPIVVAQGCGISGSACLSYTPSADPMCMAEACSPGMCCYENLRWQDLNADTSMITQGSFDQIAYYEFYIASTGKAPSYWADVWLYLNPSGSQKIFTYHPWSYRPDPAFRRVQIPLRALSDGTNLLTHQDLMAGINGFDVGSNWDESGSAYLDEVAIWY
jgi:hypothetical protein